MISSLIICGPRGAAIHERPLSALGCRDGVPLVDNPVDVIGHVDRVCLAD